MDGLKLRHIPILLAASVVNFFRPTPRLTRSEVEAKVDSWEADWLAGNKQDAVDDIMWMIEGER